MNRRLVCLLMACALLLSAISICPIRVRAASEMKISEEALTFIKTWEGFSKHPYKDGNQYTVGYGTRCPDELLDHYTEVGITEEEAIELLMNMIAGFESSVNQFIDRHGLTFSQQQFDAIVSLVFNVGSNWLYNGETLIRVLTTEVTKNEFIFGLVIYSISNGVRSKGHIMRRLTEVNIYLNGVYEMTPPDNYHYVIYDACGGVLDEYGVQGFDATEPVELYTTANREGYKFLGWFTEEEGGEKVEILDDTLPNGKYLYAQWEAIDPPPEVDPPTTEPPTTEPPTTEPPITEPPETEPPQTEPPVTNPPETEPPQTEPPVTEPPVTEPPVTEPPVTEPPVTQPPVTEPPVTEPPMPSVTPEANGGVQVTVTNTGVNVRKGPGTGFAITGSVALNQKITITATAENDGFLWGQYEGGWLCLKYTDYETVKNPPILFSGTVYNADNLNIRENPGTAYNVVGQYHNGDRVDILETKMVGAVEWGRTELGWISLDYIRRDGEEIPDDPTPPPPTQTWTGTVVVDDLLYIRSGAGKYNSITGVLVNGNTVTIYERIEAEGTQWGRVDRGWICLDYVIIDGEEPDIPPVTEPPVTEPPVTEPPVTEPPVTEPPVTEPPVTEPPVTEPPVTEPPVTEPPVTEPPVTEPPAPQPVTMTVNTCSLRIRKGAGLGYSITDYLPFGERIVILETKTVGSTVWGRTEAGWVNMRYLK